MLNVFTPNEYIENFQSLNVQELKKKGIKLIICDLDNTLAAHDELYPSEDVKMFVQCIKDVGLKLCLISNNHKSRVATFAKPLAIPFYSFAKKPMKTTYKKVLNDYSIEPAAVAGIGDQLLTDVFGGNRMKIYTILTKPLYEKDLNGTKINRKIENKIFKRLEKKNKLKKGVFDE